MLIASKALQLHDLIYGEVSAIKQGSETRLKKSFDVKTTKSSDWMKSTKLKSNIMNQLFSACFFAFYRTEKSNWWLGNFFTNQCFHPQLKIF